MKKSTFGELFSIKSSTLTSYTSGTSNPPIELIQKICKHFNISIDDFINIEMIKTSTSTAPKIVPKVGESGTMELDDKAMVIEAQKETIESLREQITLLKDKVSMLETTKARAS